MKRHPRDSGEMSLMPLVETTVAERSTKCSLPGSSWILLSWLADEQLEGVVLLVEGAEGHRVGVEVEGEPQSVPGKGVFDISISRYIDNCSKYRYR